MNALLLAFVLFFAALAYLYPLVAIGWVLLGVIVLPWVARELGRIGREYAE